MKNITVDFPVDFDTNKAIGIWVGRIILGDGGIIRLVFTPEGLKALVTLKKGTKHFYSNDEPDDGVEFAGFDPK